MRYSVLSISFVILLACSIASAETVSVKKTHLCCGGCQAGAEEALSEVKGISSISCDLNTKIISFNAEADQVAEAGVEALAKAGFYGQATHGKKKLKFPASGAKKGAKSDSMLVGGVHLCCSACVKASQEALTKVKGVSVLDIDRNEKTIKLTGDSIEILEAVSALNKAGFYCRLPQAKSE